jgi:RNA polymerase sigma-54 factor
MWQLGAMVVRPEVREAAELVIGNLDEDGYLTASEEELMAAVPPATNVKNVPGAQKPVAAPAEATPRVPLAPQTESLLADVSVASSLESNVESTMAAVEVFEEYPDFVPVAESIPPVRAGAIPVQRFTRSDLREAMELVRQMDPVGVASSDLRECLLAQVRYHQSNYERQKTKSPHNGATEEILGDAFIILDQHLKLVQNRQTKELAKAIARPIEAVQSALDFIKTLDPRPGQRYNKIEPRLIEPDVAFIKQGDEYLVVLNDDDLPQLRLNPTYRRLLNRDQAEKDVRNYVKEKYKSAIQLIKNIEQRKQTILKVCYAIIGRQREFLDKGIDCLAPMMIKEVAEEIGVHPSTVSRAVANKYAHTPQGVYELRYFFTESVQGPEGGNTSLLILKRRVKKLIEEEDSARPYTDEQITRILQSQGIQVTRRTVAKYREDMRIPSTHQRRVKN